jgi:hypothetical protein
MPCLVVLGGVTIAGRFIPGVMLPIFADPRAFIPDRFRKDALLRLNMALNAALGGYIRPPATYGPHDGSQRLAISIPSGTRRQSPQFYRRLADLLHVTSSSSAVNAQGELDLIAWHRWKILSEASRCRPSCVCPAATEAFHAQLTTTQA